MTAATVMIPSFTSFVLGIGLGVFLTILGLMAFALLASGRRADEVHNRELNIVSAADDIAKRLPDMRVDSPVNNTTLIAGILKQHMERDV